MLKINDKGIRAKLDRLCELEYGHKLLHYCLHGPIQNSLILTEEQIKIKVGEDFYNFLNGDSMLMFSCYQYCREQKRGHVHLLDSNNIENERENIKSGLIKKYKENIYECKCEKY